MPNVQISPLRPSIIPNVVSGSLGAIVRAYKAAMIYRINVMRGSTETPVWQRNYFEHIIRNERDYETIWSYIESNPRNWMDDQLNPYSTLVS